MKKLLLFSVILALSIFGLHLQAMEQSIEDATIQYSWDTLPEEVKLHILSFLPSKVEKIKDFFDYALVNNDFASVIHACTFSEIKNYKFKGKEKLTINDIFFKAVQDGHCNVVKTFIERGINVNEKDNYDHTALIVASIYDRTETVKLLINNGADLEYNGHNALAAAAVMGRTAIVKLLLDHGANIEAKNRHGNTALIETTKSSVTETAKFLINHGANIEAQDENGITALMLAATYGSIASVKLFIDHGVNVNARDPFGTTALILAAQNGHKDIVALLLDNGADIKDSNIAIKRAVKGCHVRVVRLLQDRCAIWALSNNNS